MNYIRYNPQTGIIKSYGYMPEELIKAEIDNGKPTIPVTDISDFENWKVNLETKELERINPEAPLPEIPPEVLAVLYNNQDE